MYSLATKLFGVLGGLGVGFLVIWYGVFYTNEGYLHGGEKPPGAE